MRFPANLRVFLAKKYENLFMRRFRIENEHLPRERLVAVPPQRNRFRIAGSIFPTASILPRYQY